MTTDPFTTAARAEAEDWIGMNTDDHDNFVAGAVWARDHLATQEPTDALVDQIAEQIDYEDDPWDRTDQEIVWGNPEDERGEEYRIIVRRVLAHARAARQENR